MTDAKPDPKNIVLCADGTGNRGGETPDTNVYRMYQAVDLHLPPGQPQQITFYDNGVGTHTNKYWRALTGALGFGFRRNIKDLYEFLARNYEPGDSIYLFGFSRGAATVRALAGMLQNCGLIDKSGADCQLNGEFNYDVFVAMIDVAFDHYRQGTGEYFKQNTLVHEHVRVRFVGVWDTVSALGFPYHRLEGSRFEEILERPLLVWLARASDRLSNYIPWFAHDFYEYTANKTIDHVYHAIAIDDERKSFQPRVWNELTDNEDDSCQITQVWFTGMHSDVGGSYNLPGLAYETMHWMMLRAQHHGLKFSGDALEAAKDGANAHGKIHDSRDGLAGVYRYAPRYIDQLCKMQNSEIRKLKGEIQVHRSVLDRMRRPTDRYAPGYLPQKFAVVDSPLQPLAPGTPGSGELSDLHAKSANLKIIECSQASTWEEDQKKLNATVQARRRLYRVFADSFLLLGLFALYLWNSDQCDLASFAVIINPELPLWNLGISPENPMYQSVMGQLSEVLKYFLPAMLEPFGEEIVIKRPTILIPVVLFYYGLSRINRHWRNRTLSYSVEMREKILKCYRSSKPIN